MKGYGSKQGDMSPKVDDYQKPASNWSQVQPGKTDEYIARQDAHQSAACSKVKNMSYKGRYS